MANIIVGLTISSSDVLSTPLAVSESFSASVDSGSLIRAKVKGTAVDTNDMIVYLANDKNERAYLYIKNLEPELENYIHLRNETESDSAFAAKIPLAPDKTYAVHATKINSLIEYGVFGDDNSAVIFGGSGS